MSVFHCDRCGELFDTNNRFMTASIVSIQIDPHEVIDQILLCDVCANELDTALSLETQIIETEY